MKVKLNDGVLVNIYELRDPRDDSKSPRYVGITTKQIEKRLSGHLTKKSLDKHTYKNHWINQLLRNNLLPEIHLIEEVTGWRYACKVERYYIKEFKVQGHKLTNSTKGGEGIPGYKFSEEDKKKIKASKKETSKIKELSNTSGVSLVKNTGKWESYIWVDNKKICLGTFTNKEDAKEIRKLVVKEKYNTDIILVEKIKYLIKEYRKKEWCDLLLQKSPNITFVKKVKKWKATTFHMGGKHKFLGEYQTKEDAIQGYYKGVKLHVEDILSKRDI